MGSRSASADSMPPHAPAWISSKAAATLIRIAVATLSGSWLWRATEGTYDWLRLGLESVMAELLITRRGRSTRPHASARSDMVQFQWPDHFPYVAIDASNMPR